jgi:hypothetical protein
LVYGQLFLRKNESVHATGSTPVMNEALGSTFVRTGAHANNRFASSNAHIISERPWGGGRGEFFVRIPNCSSRVVSKWFQV